MLRDIRYARQNLTPERLEEVSKKLGVRVETLLEAQQQYQKFSETNNLDVSKRNRGSYLSAMLPYEFRQQWYPYAKRRKVRHTLLLRSVVHNYLKSSYEPLLVDSDRKNVRVDYIQKQVRATVTWAARSSFLRRAERLHVYPSVLLLSLIKETWEGTFSAPGTISHTRLDQMFTQEDKYYQPE